MTISVIRTHLRVDAAHHTNRIMGQGDEEVGDVSGITESGNIFLL